MFFMLIKNRPFIGYLEIIAAVLPLFFAVLAEFINNFPRKRPLFKFVIVIFFAQQLLILNFAVENFSVMNSDFVSNYTRYEVEKCSELKEIISPAERNSVVYWGDGLPICHWILITGILPRDRFFENVWAFAEIDSNVKAQWIKTVQDNPPTWIIYSAMQKEFLGDNLNDLQSFFRRNRDSDVEQLLAEKYNFAGEMELYKNSLRLYRLKNF